MSGIASTPAPSNHAALPAPAVAQPILVTVNDPPAAFANLVVGSLLSGTIVGHDADGRVLLKTPVGTLPLAIDLDLPVGTKVTFEVRAAGARLQFILLRVEPPPAASAKVGRPGGTTARQAEPPTSASSQGAVPPGAAGPAGVGDALGAPRPTALGAPGVIAPGNTVRAVVLAPSVADPATGRVAPAHQVSLLIGALAPPDSANPPAAAAPGSAAAQATTPAPGTQPGTPPPGAPNATLPTAAVDVARGLAGETGAALARQDSGLATHGTQPGLAAAGRTALPGIVTGLSVDGNPIVSTPLGRVVIAGQPLPPGSSIVFDVVARQSATVAEPLAGAFARPGAPWPALVEAIAALETFDPALAAQAIDRALPTPGPRLAAGILFFVSALSAGDLRGWLGAPVLEALGRAGHAALVQRLSDEFQALGRLFAEPPGQQPGTGTDWRTLILPFHDGAALAQIRLFLRRRGRDGDGDREMASEDDETRFVVEAELSRLGPLQLDGLVRHGRFDLMVRSRRELELDTRREIAAIFRGSNAITGTTGEIGFEQVAAFPVHPLEDAAHDRAGVFA